jgi:hypothetical protein
MCKLVKTHHIYILSRMFSTKNAILIVERSVKKNPAQSTKFPVCPSTVANSNGKHMFQINDCMVIMRKLWEKLKHALYRKKISFQSEIHFFSKYFSFTIFSVLFFVGFDVRVPEEPREIMKVLWIRSSLDQYNIKKIVFLNFCSCIGAYEWLVVIQYHCDNKQVHHSIYNCPHPH